MNVNNKFIYSKTKDSFLQILPTIPEGLNPIVFIEDSKQIWTCGTYFSMGDVELKVSEIDGSIKVNVGNDSFFLSTSGEALSIRKGDGNSIVITSSALTKLNTDTVLKWDAVNKKISHNQTAVKIGKYGPGTNETDVSIITVPNFTVDQYGHLIEAGEVNVKIRDYVNQLAASEDNTYRPILLSYNEGFDEASTSEVRKANGLEYNDGTGNLKLSKGGIEVSEDVVVKNGDLIVEKGVIKGDLEGNVSGNATPKIHLSATPDYGGASKELFGHVRLIDELGVTAPSPSSDNTVTTNTDVNAIAASPLLVWNALEAAKQYADNLLGGIGGGSTIQLAGTLIAKNISIFTPQAKKGEMYIVDVENSNPCYINQLVVDKGDILLCINDTFASNDSNLNEIKLNWNIIQANISTIIETDIGNVELKSDSNLKILGSNGIHVTAKNGGIDVSGLKVTAINQNDETIELNNGLNLSNDFAIDDANNLYLRWTEI